jgi:hypothetical protein
MGRLHYDPGVDPGIRCIILSMLWYDQGARPTTARHTARMATVDETDFLRLLRALCMLLRSILLGLANICRTLP